MILTHNAEIDFFKWLWSTLEISKKEYNEFYSWHPRHSFIESWFCRVNIQIDVIERNGLFHFRINGCLFVKAYYSDHDEAFEAAVIWANQAYNNRFKEV